MKRIYTLIMLMIAPFAYSQDEPREMVFVHSYHFGYPWVQQYRSGFNSQITEFVIHDFQMDTKRRPKSDFEGISDQAWAFIEEKKPDVVVIADDNALKYLGPRLTKHRIPTFFLGVNANPRQYVNITGNISGVLERPLLKRSVHMIKKLQPDVKRIKVMMDAAATSDAILLTSFGNKKSLVINGIEVTAFLVNTIEEWHQHVHSIADDGFDALIIANYAALKDNQGTHIPLEDVSRWTSQYTGVPLYAFWTYSVGKGKAIGGLAISALEQGAEVAVLVNQYVESGNMPVISTPKKGAMVFSEYELDRWRINVPEELLNRAELRE
ncbi:ABC transporter substrate-binding protein [Vibrio profundi]|uniref:ABC transporter substrate-binding protein n=1 Tax=Vibrio profundi TaxID=1774960 RepID=UPI0037359A90